MIKLIRDEYREGNLAIRQCKVTFFGIPIYRARISSTNNMAVRQLTVVAEQKLNIKGFNNETNNSSKETQQGSRSSKDNQQG